MKNRQSLLLWMLLFFGSVSVFAQHVVKGRITDAKTGEPLVGVNVVLKGSSESGTISDLNGNYSLSVPESSSLIFSYIGYVTQEISVKGKSVLDISLSEDMEALEEVVVIGYGTMKKSDLTGSLSSVKSEDLTAYAVPNPVQALQGRAPGVKLHRILVLQKGILRFVSVVQIRLKEVMILSTLLMGSPRICPVLILMI